jgi:hypothetical protein
MKTATWIALLGLLLILPCAPTEAQHTPQPSPEFTDAGLVRFLDQERVKPNGAGLVLISVIFDKAFVCGGVVSVSRMVAGNIVAQTVIPLTAGFFDLPVVEPKALAAGDYLVGWVRCRGSGRSTTVVRGPHAKFQVRPGEFVNVGALAVANTIDNFKDIIMTGNSELHRDIVEIPPARIAALHEKFPGLMRRLVKRPMVLIGPPDQHVVPAGQAASMKPVPRPDGSGRH